MRFTHKFYGQSHEFETTVGANGRTEHGCKLIYVKRIHFDKSACALAHPFLQIPSRLLFAWNLYSHTQLCDCFIEWYSNQTTHISEPMNASGKVHKCQAFCISYCHTCVICMRVQSQQVLCVQRLKKLVNDRKKRIWTREDEQISTKKKSTTTTVKHVI